MARRPRVFLRPLSMDEGRKLQKISRSSKDPVRLRRAIVVMMSGQGQAARDITSLQQVGEDYVRDVHLRGMMRGTAHTRTLVQKSAKGWMTWLKAVTAVFRNVGQAGSRWSSRSA